MDCPVLVPLQPRITLPNTRNARRQGDLLVLDGRLDGRIWQVLPLLDAILLDEAFKCLERMSGLGGKQTLVDGEDCLLLATICQRQTVCYRPVPAVPLSATFGHSSLTCNARRADMHVISNNGRCG